MIRFKSLEELKAFLERDNGINNVYWLGGGLDARRYVILLNDRGQLIVNDRKTGSRHGIDEHYLTKIRIL